MILFLDFDGVLHPEGEGHLPSDGAEFCFLPRLEALLRQFPHVDVVVSSSWRERLPYEALIAPFSGDIRRRIIGVTPARGMGRSHSYAHRESEILAWIDRHAAQGQQWVALDDAEWQFDTHKDHLVVCGFFSGFDETAEAELRAHFQKKNASE